MLKLSKYLNANVQAFSAPNTVESNGIEIDFPESECSKSK